MNKYASIALDGGGVEQFSVKDVASCYLDGNDDIIIDYIGGSKVTMASAAALVQADVDIVFGVIKSAQQQKWTKVLYSIPALSEPVNSFVFTF